MELPKKLTDEMLKNTESKPKDLLKWFKSLWEIRENEVPCVNKPYLGEYCFLRFEYEDFGDIYDIWDWARESKKNFNNLIKQFKKLYNLK